MSSAAMRATYRCVSISLGALAISSLWATAAAAQAPSATASAENVAAPAESAAESNDAQSIIVTGSRLARSTFDSPQPVTVLGGEEFERLQITNVGEGVSELPSFRPSNNPSTNGFGSFNVGAQIVNLRGLGVTRNLVLVDGRRFAPTTREGSVDLNFVPDVTVVPVGSSVSFPNSDDVSHQVYSFSPARRFQLPLYRGKPHAPVVFDQPGIVTLGCNIHDNMVAYIVVTPAPFYGRTDQRGGWVIPNLPDRDTNDNFAWLSDTVPAAEIARLRTAAAGRTPAAARQARELYEVQARNLARLNAAGVIIGFGTDSGVSVGWTAHTELADMVAAGMTPAQVLMAATRTAARILRLDQLGTIGPGKSADFIVLDANPLDDITNTRKIAAVYLRGAAVDRSKPAE